ncbi:MAG: CapA family protein [Daejeonella sp.]
MIKRGFFFLYTLVIILGFKCLNANDHPGGVVLNDSIKEHIPDTLTIAAVGDIMMGSAFPDIGNLSPDDGKGSFTSTLDYLKSADVAFGNLEGVLLNKGNSGKCGPNSTACYAFRMPERYVEHLTDAGFDVMSVANNHSGDFSETGRKSTARVLDSAGIKFAGFITHPTTTFKRNGITYGFCAFAPNTGTVSINDLENVKSIISELRKTVDIVIVSFHGGGEGTRFQRVTRKSEFFYGQNRGNVYEFAHTAIDAGADLVLGHGPHVTRAIEVYKNKFITYSMGNFCTYGMFNLDGVTGMAPLFQIKLTNKGDFISANIISVLQKKNVFPIIDPDKGALKQITSLTALDFPESNLDISATGLVELKK